MCIKLWSSYLNRKSIQLITKIFKDNKTKDESAPPQRAHPAVAKIKSHEDPVSGTLVVECPNLWIFRNSFFFAGVVGTTIGYGDVYPATTGENGE